MVAVKKKEQAEIRLCVADLRADELMTADVVTVRKDETIDSVWQILQHIHHVVVIDKQKHILGIISHRDLVRWSAAFIGKALPLLSSVEAILQPFARSCSVATSIRTVAIEMLEHKYGCTPITDASGVLQGILTESDFVTFFSPEKWRHPVRVGQTVKFKPDSKAKRTSAAVERLRKQLQDYQLFVEDCMSTDIQTLKSGNTLEDVDGLMRRYHVRHVPVTESGGKLVGILSQRDYLRVAIPEFTADSSREALIRNAGEPVSKYMKRDLITVDRKMPLTEAAELIVSHRIGCLPVVEGGEMIGILSRSDFVRLFANGV